MGDTTNPVTVFIFKACGAAADAKHPTRPVTNCPKVLALGYIVQLDDMDKDVYDPALDWLEQRFWSGKRAENPDDEIQVGFDDRNVVVATMNLTHRLRDTAAFEYAKERLVYMIAQTPPGSLPEWRPLLGLPQDGGFLDVQDEASTELEHRFVHLGESPSQRADPGEKWGLRKESEYEAVVDRVNGNDTSTRE